MRIWVDSEFIEDGKTIDLLSIGMVREDGQEYYAESREADWTRASAWVKNNVLGYLDLEIHGRTRREIRSDILAFAGPRPEFWGYYADYDWVVLCQLFGTMMGLPRNWPMYCHDLKQWCDQLGNPQLPEQTGVEHHALEDARWTKTAWEFLENYQRERFKI